MTLYLFTDMNECELEIDMCDNEVVAVCNNTIGSYVCMCKPEYTGDGFNCTGTFTAALNVTIVIEV